jgi:hypothetical protein
METKLLLAVIASAGKTGPVQLNSQQQKAAAQLAKRLKDGSDTSCSQLLRNLLLSLYAPKAISMHAIDIFSSPVVAFLALLCKTEQGAYDEISKIGQKMAKIQTCIRLRCLGYLVDNLQKTPVKGTNDEWIEYEAPLTLILYADL